MPSSNKRSLVKALTWETFTFILTACAVRLVFGDWIKSIEFSLVLTIIKVIFFYLHERIWKKSRWGKK